MRRTARRILVLIVALALSCGLWASNAWAAGQTLTAGTTAGGNAPALQTMADLIGFAEIPDNPETILLGEQKDVTISQAGEVVTFAFTPQSTGDYYFTSMGGEDTSGYVLTRTERIDYNYDYSFYDDDFNFRVYFCGEAGITYFLQAELSDPEDTASFIVTVGQGKKPVGFAEIPANPTKISPGQQKTATIAQGGEAATFAFTPTATGKYSAYAYADEHDTQLCVFTEEEFIDKATQAGNPCFIGEAGVTYYLQVIMENTSDTGEVTVSLNEYDDGDGDDRCLSIGGAEILKEGSDGTYTVVTSNLPDGMQYDLASSTLTLTNCTLDLSSSPDVREYLQSGSSLNIVLNGTNVFTGLSCQGGAGIVSAGDLRISGSGSLTMDFSKTIGGAVGVWGYNNIEIDGVTFSIIGGDEPREGAFYGIEPMAWENYYKFKNAKDMFSVTIKDANLSISSTVSNTYWNEYYQRIDDLLNVGIDSQDCDLTIVNSQVQIEMTGGITWGMGSGLEKYGSFYGGKLSIDDKSHVTIKLTDTCENYVNYGYTWSLYFVEDCVESNYIYAAEIGQPIYHVDKSVLHKHVGFEDRNECVCTYLELSPVELDYDDPPVTPPDPTIVKGDVTGDGVVAMNDILKINSHLLGRIQLTADELTAADVTGDGDVAMNDILKINSFLLGRIESL